MTAWELRFAFQEKHPESHYFDADTMRFFGETMGSMKVLKETQTVTDFNGNDHECYVLSKLSRNYPTGPRRTYGYFEVGTFNNVLPREDD